MFVYIWFQALCRTWHLFGLTTIELSRHSFKNALCSMLSVTFKALVSLTNDCLWAHLKFIKNADFTRSNSKITEEDIINSVCSIL